MPLSKGRNRERMKLAMRAKRAMLQPKLEMLQPNFNLVQPKQPFWAVPTSGRYSTNTMPIGSFQESNYEMY